MRAAETATVQYTVWLGLPAVKQEKWERESQSEEAEVLFLVYKEITGSCVTAVSLL